MRTTTRRDPRPFLLAAGLAVLLTGCGGGEGSAAVDASPAVVTTSGATADEADPSAGASAEPTGGATADPSTTPSAGASSGATSDGTDAGGETVAAPAYLVGDTPFGPRLYREFHRVPAADPLGGATDVLVTGDVADPDYRTLLGDLDVASVTETDGAVVVDLAQAPPEGSVAGDQAALAVQQLVWTLQGVAQERLPLRVTVAGEPVRLFGQATDAGVEAAPELETLSLVNITTPGSGAVLSGSFTATGVSSSFEASGPWQLVDGAGTVVLRGGAQAEGWVDGLYPWQVEVDLSGVAPGEYTFVAMTDDPSGGTEGPGPFSDTKAVTVR